MVAAVAVVAEMAAGTAKVDSNRLSLLRTHAFDVAGPGTRDRTALSNQLIAPIATVITEVTFARVDLVVPFVMRFLRAQSM